MAHQQVIAPFTLPPDLSKREAIMFAMRSLWLLDCEFTKTSGNNEPDNSGALYESGDKRYEELLPPLESLKSLGEDELYAQLKTLVKVIITPVDPSPRQIVDLLIEEQQQSDFEKGWVVHRLAEHPKIKCFELEDWQYVAKLLGYSSGWAWHQYVELS